MRLSGYGKQKNKSDYAGFTLIECVVALLVLSLILVSFSWVLQIEKKLGANQVSQSSRRWHLFVISFEGTSREWELVKVEPEQLFFTDKTTAETLRIEFVSGQLRKRKRRGSELMLADLERVNYQVSEMGLRMDVRFNDGKSFQSIFSQW